MAHRRGVVYAYSGAESANREAANFDSKSFEDLHSYPSVAERRIALFHFNDKINECLILRFSTWNSPGLIRV